MPETSITEHQQNVDDAVGHLADRIAASIKLSNEQFSALRAGFVTDPAEGLSTLDSLVVSSGVDVGALVSQVARLATEALSEPLVEPRKYFMLLLAEKLNLLPFPTARGFIKAPTH